MARTKHKYSKHSYSMIMMHNIKYNLVNINNR